jgi:hypothetical protein
MSVKLTRDQPGAVQLALAVALDAVAVLLALAALGIVVTGGAVIFVRGHRISLTGVDNPLAALALLCTLRYVLLYRSPYLGVERWAPRRVDEGARALIGRARLFIETLPAPSAVRIVLCLFVVTTIVKLVFAWTNPGFFSGDDVEIHEMSLRTLWKTEWSVWDLRNAFFPMGIIHPAQRLTNALFSEHASVAALVFGGRVIVALLSSLAIWLVWLAGRQLWPERSGYAVVATCLFSIAGLHIAFGSSELPRPVATVFVLGAFVLLCRDGLGRALIAGVMLGIAACFRFSEVMFVAPAAVMLCARRRWLLAVVVCGAAGTTMASIIAVSDSLYWGEAFHSLRAAVDYTLVQRLSSRGYQSVAWYALHAAEWITPSVLVFASIAAIRSPRLADVWVWLPLAVLTALPHKEARYAIPLIPFMCLTASRGLQLAADRISRTDPANPGWRPVALVALLILGIVHDVGHWRLPRTNGDVRFAALVTETTPSDAVVVGEQAWRLGGQLYLWPRKLVDLDPQRLSDPEYLWQRTSAGAWIVLDRRTIDRTHLDQSLQQHGYAATGLKIADSRYVLWAPPRQ